MLLCSVAVRVCPRGMLRLRRRLSLVRFLADIHFSQSQVAEESHEPQAEHVKRSQQRGDDSDHPKRPVVKKSLPKNFVFTEEAAQGREAGNGKCRYRHHPERYWNHFAQPAHVPHVLLTT